MNKNETQLLIDCYLNGVTTPEEEKLLARALLGDDIPEEWKVVRVMLGELAMGEAEYDADVAEDASRRKSFVLPLTARWLIAASVALLIGFACFNYMGRNYMGRNEERSIAEAKTERTVEQNAGTATSKTEPAVILHTDSHTTARNKPVDNNLPADNTEQNMGESQTKPYNDMEGVKPDYSEPIDGNLHYASITINDNLKNYQSPSRMEEFISKMADYHRVKGERLPYSSTEDDSLTVSTAYVFNDTKELNLFSRLLQAACWYEDTTPGYLLNYSHQQFFFRLEDRHCKTQHLWIAERIRGKILLYSAHAPLDAEMSSDGFREYRDRLSNASIKF